MLQIKDENPVKHLSSRVRISCHAGKADSGQRKKLFTEARIYVQIPERYSFFPCEYQRCGLQICERNLGVLHSPRLGLLLRRVKKISIYRTFGLDVQIIHEYFTFSASLYWIADPFMELESDN